MLEEGQHHRGRASPVSQVKHNNLSEASDYPYIQGDLNLLDFLDG